MNPSTAVNPNKALWEKGDFTAIAAFMRQSGETLAQSLGVTPGLRVLDLGCGDGTTALPLARAGAEVRASTLRGTWWRPGTSARRRRVSAS